MKFATRLWSWLKWLTGENDEGLAALLAGSVIFAIAIVVALDIALIIF